MALDAWIERSLQRLEWLEAERDRLAGDTGPAGEHAAALAECDTEIAALYDVLETAADSASDDDAPAPAPTPRVSSAEIIPVPQPMLAVPAPVAALPSAPRFLGPIPEFSDGVPELFLGDQQTLTYIDEVGWTTFRDLQPLHAAAASAPDAEFIVDDAWGGGSLGWKWMVPAAAAILLFVALGAYIGLQPSEAVASTPVAVVDAPSPPPRARPTADPTPAPAVATEPSKPIAAPPAPVAAAAGVAAEEPGPAARPTSPRRGKKRRARRRGHNNRRSRPGKRDRRIKLGKSRDPLAGL